jgi:hypothetical protein
MRRITVSVPEFVYGFLKSRSIPMSRYARNVLIGEKRHRDYGNRHQKERYHTDSEFRKRRKEEARKQRLRNKMKDGGRVNVDTC